MCTGHLTSISSFIFLIDNKYLASRIHKSRLYSI